MNGHHKRRTHPPWSNLPTKILRKIAKHLQDNISLLHFRLACKDWNYSTTISPLLPHRIDRYSYLHASTVYLVNSSWIVSSSGHMNREYAYHQVFTGSSYHDLTAEFDLGRFQTRRLCTEFHLTFPGGHDPCVKVVVSPLRALPCVSDCAVFGLLNGGRLVAYLLDPDEKRGVVPRIEISCGSVSRFDDIVEFRGMILAVDRQGNPYAIDPFACKITRAYPDKTVPSRAATRWRKRLVRTESGHLYLVVRESVYYERRPSFRTKQLFRVYKLSDDESSPVWVEVRDFGNEVLFVTQDCCFGVCTDGLDPDLKNCMVFSKRAFPEHVSQFGSKDKWCGYSMPRDEDVVGFFKLDMNHEDGNFRAISSFHNFPFVLDSSPLWAHQSPAPNPPHSQSHRLSEGNYVKIEEDESESGSGSIDDDHVLESGSNTEVTPTRVRLSVPQGGENADSVTRAWTSMASASKGSRRDSSGHNFRGLHISPGSLPILEKIFAKHGDVISNIAIRNGDIVARALESLAKAVGILEDSTGRSLTEDQVAYLTTTLNDLRLVGLRVDWLAPKVADAVEHREKRHLVSVFDDRRRVARAKARIGEKRERLLEKWARYDRKEERLDLELAELNEKISSLDRELDFDRPLGGLI